MRTATAGLPELGGSGVVDLEFGHFAEALFQAFQELAVKAALRWDERIMLPQAALADVDQTGLSQVGQMLGDAWLRGSEDLHEIRHTQFPAQQDVKDSESRPVRKSPEHRVDAVESFDRFRLGHSEIQFW